MLCDRSGRARCGASWQLRLSPAPSMIRSRSICQSMSSVAEAGEASRSRSSRRGCAWWRRAPIIAAPCVGPTRRCSSGETRRCVIGRARQRAHRRAAHPSRVCGRALGGGCYVGNARKKPECLSIMHSSWIFSIDNEWIFVVIIKTGPDFGKRILRPQLFSRRPLKDPGFWILDSETFLVHQAPAL